VLETPYTPIDSVADKVTLAFAKITLAFALVGAKLRAVAAQIGAALPPSKLLHKVDI
jgi:hypothetical protein